MNENRSLVSITVVALLIGVLAYVLASQTGFTMGPGSGQHMKGDNQIYYTFKAVLASVNSFLLITLTSIYLKVYTDTGLDFSLGLVVFSLALLLY